MEHQLLIHGVVLGKEDLLARAPRMLGLEPGNSGDERLELGLRRRAERPQGGVPQLQPVDRLYEIVPDSELAAALRVFVKIARAQHHQGGAGQGRIPLNRRRQCEAVHFRHLRVE